MLIVHPQAYPALLTYIFLCLLLSNGYIASSSLPSPDRSIIKMITVLNCISEDKFVMHWTPVSFLEKDTIPMEPTKQGCWVNKWELKRMSSCAPGCCGPGCWKILIANDRQSVFRAVLGRDWLSPCKIFQKSHQADRLKTSDHTGIAHS